MFLKMKFTTFGQLNIKSCKEKAERSPEESERLMKAAVEKRTMRSEKRRRNGLKG